MPFIAKIDYKTRGVELSDPLGNSIKVFPYFQNERWKLPFTMWKFPSGHKAHLDVYKGSAQLCTVAITAPKEVKIRFIRH